MNSETADIVIVGGGLAGLALAKSLAHLPLKLALIDVKPAQTTINSLQSIALSWISCNVFKALDLWNDLKSFAAPIEKIHISARGRWQKLILEAEEFDIPTLGYVIAIEKLHSVLQAAVAKQKNLQCYYEHEVANLNEHNDHFELQLKYQQQARSLTTHFVIAADGVNSRLRQMRGISATQSSPKITALVALIETQNNIANTAYERFVDSDTIAVLPRSDDLSGLVLTTTPAMAESWLQLPLDEFNPMIQEKFGFFLGKIALKTSLQKHEVAPMLVKQQIQPGFVLVGNAVHHLNPVAAQGFNLTLRDIAHLAEALTEVVHKQQLETKPLLNNYASLREQDQQNLFRATQWIEQHHQSKIMTPFLQETILYGFNQSSFLRRTLMKQMLGMNAAPGRLLAGIAW